MTTTTTTVAAGAMNMGDDGIISHQTEPLKPGRKRKAEFQENERLSKRLSLLNLERNGSKLYVPVETPKISSMTPTGANSSEEALPGIPTDTGNGRAVGDDDDMMQMDDSKHKVYIYNMDDELSSDGEDESDDGKLVFLPDIEKHLKLNRIPRHVLANDDGELAGMQMVLYSDPKSLTVPEEKDSVRKAIIEARQRHRDKQTLEREASSAAAATEPAAPVAIPLQADTTVAGRQQSPDDVDAMDVD